MSSIETGDSRRAAGTRLRVVDTDAHGAGAEPTRSELTRRWLELDASGAGKGERLRLVFEHCHAMVYAVSCRITGSSWDAEDVTQSVFEEFSKRMHKLRHPTAIPSFLKTIAVRTSLHRVRRERWRRRRLRLGGAPGPHAFEAGPEDATTVRQLLAQLDPEPRAAVVLKYVEMNSHEEVAALMGVSSATARRRLAEGRAKLIALIGEPRVRGMFGGED